MDYSSFVVAGLGATTDPHRSLLYCAFYTPLASTSVSLSDPVGEGLRSSLLRGLVTGALLRPGLLQLPNYHKNLERYYQEVPRYIT